MKATQATALLAAALPVALAISFSTDTEHKYGDIPRSVEAMGVGSLCTDTEGAWYCMTETFQRCASGQWSVVMNCAPGTVCEPEGLTYNSQPAFALTPAPPSTEIHSSSSSSSSSTSSSSYTESGTSSIPPMTTTTMETNRTTTTTETTGINTTTLPTTVTSFVTDTSSPSSTASASSSTTAAPQKDTADAASRASVWATGFWGLVLGEIVWLWWVM